MRQSMEIRPRYRGMSNLNKLSTDELNKLAEAAGLSVKKMKGILHETETHSNDVKKTCETWDNDSKTIRLFNGGKPKNSFPEGGHQVKQSFPTNVGFGKDAFTKNELQTKPRK